MDTTVDSEASMPEITKSGRKSAAQIFVLLFTFVALLIDPLARTQGQDHSLHKGHAGHKEMSQPVGALSPAAEAAYQAKLLADKRESEFNHHVAGIFVILAGIFILAEGSLRSRWPFVRFVWPICFLCASLFLLLFSDTELWPFGRMSWWYGLTHRAEDLQHKIFAVILLGLGLIEIQRARGVLKTAWSSWAFPILAALGSVLLLFHEHDSGAHAADHMAIMQRIQSQHLGFAVTGFGIGLTKGLSEVRINWQSIFAKLWPALMIVLGLLLLLYRE
jgi:copper resistance protein D